MKPIKNCLAAHENELSKSLRSLGFSKHQIATFLSKSATNIASSNSKKDADQNINKVRPLVSSEVFRSKHIANFTPINDLSHDQVTNRFKTISPFFLKSFLHYK